MACNRLRFGRARAALNDVGNNRNRPSTEVCSQSEHLRTREADGRLIHRDGQLVSQFEGSEFGMVSHRWPPYSLQSAASSLLVILPSAKSNVKTACSQSLRNGSVASFGKGRKALVSGRNTPSLTRA